MITKQSIKAPGRGIVSLQMESEKGKQADIDSAELLAAHNAYRAQVGVTPLVWSTSLAQSAQQWANHLAEIHDLVHSDNNRYGENIWEGTIGAYSLTQMVDSWGSEKKDYIPGSTFPASSTTGNWQDVGHYSSKTLANSRHVGFGGNDDPHRMHY
ncbi:CAP domain-containing protein [Dictyobacter kobayashii]|uniref:CAP domain-containing protein n=1 Tax=Dictyobacter kobayashii TaxID=2014872 RepID=UPI001C3FEB88|nr:CAP domain-containing protein [Dictyobacter kobayashii]